MKPDDPKRAATMHERIRRRREEREIPAYVLAKRLGISPSYVSLIESGRKVPGEDIARRMAEALEDDVDLYVAWARSSGIADLDGYTEGLVRLRDYSLRSGQDIPKRASHILARMASPSPDTTQSDEHPIAIVPVLEDGADPSLPRPRSAEPSLRLDSRLFDAADRDRLFAYRATPAMAKRAGGAFRSGDWLVFSSRVEAGDAQSVHAVRSKGRVAVGRVLVKGSEVLLLPPPGESDYEIVALGERSDLGRVLAGRLVLRLRRT